MQYSEGIDVGYRWYDAQGLTPLFPFGYGLSYTSFSFSNLKIRPLPPGRRGHGHRHRDQHRVPGRAPTWPSCT